jgi:AcrR family transcriptional regulator
MGRPRQFDVEEALDRATRQFWAKGYAGTTLDELTEAMGINRPSLYRVFGNKETLFARVVEHFEATYLTFVGEALASKTPALIIRRLLEGPYAYVSGPARRAVRFLRTGLRRVRPVTRESAFFWRSGSKLMNTPWRPASPYPKREIRLWRAATAVS